MFSRNDPIVAAMQAYLSRKYGNPNANIQEYPAATNTPQTGTYMPQRQTNPYDDIGVIDLNADAHAKRMARLFGWQRPEPTTRFGQPIMMAAAETTAPPFAPIPTPKPPAPERPILPGIPNQEVYDMITDEERLEKHIYLDIEGKPTTGYGTMMPDVKAAQGIKFIWKNPDGSTRPASKEEIAQAYDKVKTQPYGQNYKAGRYFPDETNQLDPVFIPESEAARKRDEHLYDDVYYLRQKFPKFDEFPVEKQKALLDMHYNIGPIRFTQPKWKNLFEAINGPFGADSKYQPDWSRAAKESHRKLIGDTRNQKTYDRFMKDYPLSQ